MRKIADLRGHTSRVLHLALSPDGTTVASAAADETLRFWKVFQPSHSYMQMGKGSSGFSLHLNSCPQDALMNDGQKFLASSSSVFGTGMNLR